jgi:hypothetical protein
VVAFNLVKTVDIILNYYHAVHVGLPALAGQLGAAYAIPNAKLGFFRQAATNAPKSEPTAMMEESGGSTRGGLEDTAIVEMKTTFVEFLTRGRSRVGHNLAIWPPRSVPRS